MGAMGDGQGKGGQIGSSGREAIARQIAADPAAPQRHIVEAEIDSSSSLPSVWSLEEDLQRLAAGEPTLLETQIDNLRG